MTHFLGTGVTVNSLHPGSVATELGRYFPGFTILYPTLSLFFKSPWEGAQTNIHCAVEESLENVTGKYFRYCSRDVVIVNSIQGQYYKQRFDKLMVPYQQIHIQYVLYICPLILLLI